MAKKRHGSAVHAPAAQAEKFCRTSRQMPGGSASSEQSARRTTERSDHSAAVMAIQAEKRSGYSDRPSCRKDGPCRTRRLRHGLSQNTERPCSNTCKGFRLHEILPPDVLRRGRSQAVVRRRRGEVICCPAAVCELSAIVKGGTLLQASSLSLI